MREGVIKRAKPNGSSERLVKAVESALGVMPEADRKAMIDRLLAKERTPRRLDPPELFDSDLLGVQVTVTPDGEIFCFPVCTNGVTLDEIRLAAASHYLEQKRCLTLSQYRYWSHVSQTTQLKNFESRKGNRR